MDDLGILESMKVHYQLPLRPTKKEAIEIGEKWKPFRTIATWYLWRGMGE